MSERSIILKLIYRYKTFEGKNRDNFVKVDL